MPYFGTKEGLIANPTKTDEWDNLMYELKKRKEERKKDEVRMKKKAERLRLKKEGK